MTSQMRRLEGKQVSVSLRGGDRLDACQLISGSRSGTGTVWLFWNGIDVFIPVENVLDVWEVPASRVA
jgi:hypothetical protein